MFEMKNKRSLGKLCQIVLGPQFQNFTLKGCFLTFRRASENGPNNIIKIYLLSTALKNMLKIQFEFYENYTYITVE